MSEMTEEEKNAAMAYIKLHEDVKKLIVKTVMEEFMNSGSALHAQIVSEVVHSYSFKDQVKAVVRDQMVKL